MFEIRLDDNTNGTTVHLQDHPNGVQFFDSGGPNGPYPNNKIFNIIFDAGEDHHIKLTFGDFEFEPKGNSALYDSLAIQVSNDGISWFNFSGIPWMQKSITEIPSNLNGNNTIYSTDSNGVEQPFDHPDSYGIDGWILPENNATAETLVGNNNLFPYNHLTSYRFVKFFFFSDSAFNKSGWDIKIIANYSGIRVNEEAVKLERMNRLRRKQNNLPNSNRTSSGSILKYKMRRISSD